MAVDKGWFTLKVEINDGHGGTIKTQAEVGMRNILSVSHCFKTKPLLSPAP